MTMTNAMFTGFTGIKSNQTMVNTVGNDIANLNTTAYKQQRTLFETLLYETAHPGEGPSETSGGRLPIQIGRGSAVAAVDRTFAQGAIEDTGLPADVALNGRGFFVVQTGSGDQRFTRDGAFGLNPENTLVSANGDFVQGYTADATGAISRDALSNLVIPIGATLPANPTQTVFLEGNLNSEDTPATAGESTSQPLITASGAAAEATQLSSLVDEFGEPILADGDILTIQAKKGEVNLPAETFTVGETGSTVGDFIGYLETILGINVDADPNAGVSIADGALVVHSNIGRVNEVDLTSTAIGSTGRISNPFLFTQTLPATGDGVSTSFDVYDSLGQAVPVRMQLVMESKNDGSAWRYFAESTANGNLSPIVGTGTLSFDSQGQLVGSEGAGLSLDRSGSGAATPQTINLDFAPLTALARTFETQEVSMREQDGSPAGILLEFDLDDQGIIHGKFSNDREQVLGQLAVATFINDRGLLAEANNLYTVGPDSGDPTIGVADEGIAGTVVSRALEQSNVELVREFVDLIAASTGISAASRVVRSTDDLLQELILLAR